MRRALPVAGQSLIEVLIAIAIGAVLLAAAAGLIAPVLSENTQVQNLQTMVALQGGLVSDIRAWGASDWNGLLALATTSANLYYLNATSSPFAVTASSTDGIVSVGNLSYLRYFYIDDVYRDSSGNATTAASGNTYDPSTKMVTVSVVDASSTKSSTTLVMYLTRYANNTTGQASWAGGAIGDSVPVTQFGTSYAALTDIAVNSSGTLNLAIVSGTLYATSGTLDSSVFDTGVASGTALNSIVWHGAAPSGTSVGFQIAVSNCANGATNSPSCSTGSWTYYGSNGDSASYFTGPYDTPITLDATIGGYSLFSGYRYFRYRIKLNADGSQVYTPTVEQVWLNWSP